MFIRVVLVFLTKLFVVIIVTYIIKDIISLAKAIRFDRINFTPNTQEFNPAIRFNLASRTPASKDFHCYRG
jgi:hypothetical protein